MAFLSSHLSSSFLHLLCVLACQSSPSFAGFRENSRLAAEVYKDMPETSFTRTISNPEVVMKRRRQQKLEKRMQEFISSDGRPDSGKTPRSVMGNIVLHHQSFLTAEVYLLVCGEASQPLLAHSFKITFKIALNKCLKSKSLAVDKC